MASAGDSLIGALRVSLSADTAAFEQGLKSAQSSLSGFSRSIKGPLLAIGAALAGATAAVAVGIKSALDTADELGKASQKFGVPIEQLSALKYAADLSGVSFEALGVGLKKLSQSMAAGSSAFGQIGVAVKDANGALRPTQDVLLDVAGAFAGMKDGAQKTALAVQIFGKAGADLIPLLNAGKVGLAGMLKEARDLGLVIDTQTAKAAENFNDNLTKMHRIISGVFIQIAAAVAGPLADLTNKLFEMAKSGDLARGAVGLFNSVLKFGQSIVLEFGGAIQKLNEIGLALAKTWDILAGDDPNRWELIKRVFADLQSSMALINRDTQEAVATLSKPLTGGGRDIATQLSDRGSAGTGGTDGTGTAGAGKKQDQLLGPPISIIPEGFEDGLNRIAETSQGIGKIWTDIGESIAGTIASNLAGLVTGTESWRDALGGVVKGLQDVVTGLVETLIKAIAVAAVMTAIGVPSAAGGTATFGQNLSKAIGFADGGSFKVGGSGGIDSQLVAFRASPNETVSITKPGQDMGGGVAFAPVFNVDARGSSLTEGQLQASMERFGKDLHRNLPSLMRGARIEGKI